MYHSTNTNRDPKHALSSISTVNVSGYEMGSRFSQGYRLYYHPVERELADFLSELDRQISSFISVRGVFAYSVLCDSGHWFHSQVVSIFCHLIPGADLLYIFQQWMCSELTARTIMGIVCAPVSFKRLYCFDLNRHCLVTDEVRFWVLCINREHGRVGFIHYACCESCNTTTLCVFDAKSSRPKEKYSKSVCSIFNPLSFLNHGAGPLPSTFDYKYQQHLPWANTSYSPHLNTQQIYSTVI